MRRLVGDLRGLGEFKLPFKFPFKFPFMAPFVTSGRCGDGMSMLNLSLVIEKCLPPPVAEVGDASGDELDMLPGIFQQLWSSTSGQMDKMYLRSTM